MFDEKPSAPPPESWRETAAHEFGPGRRLRSKSKVLPEQARGHNRALLLQTLYHSGAMSRADLAREIGLTRVTISDLVAELIRDRIVRELGVRETPGPGKPAILVDIDRDGHQIIGLDLSLPDFFEGAVMSVDGDVLERRRVPRPAAPDADAAYAATLELARGLIDASTRRLLGVGVGVPGLVAPDGMVLGSAGTGWWRFPLEDRLRSDLGVPVLVRNDANAASLAEYTFGEAAADFMLITVGFGVGSGIISDGRALVGSRFAAGEIAHVVVPGGGGARCVCGKDGCLETWINIGRLRDLPGDAASRQELLRDAGAKTAAVVAPIVAALDLSEIVLAGPADLLGGPFLAAANETIRATTLANLLEEDLVRLTHQEDVILRGTTVMVLLSQLGVS